METWLAGLERLAALLSLLMFGVSYSGVKVTVDHLDRETAKRRTLSSAAVLLEQAREQGVAPLLARACLFYYPASFAAVNVLSLSGEP